MLRVKTSHAMYKDKMSSQKKIFDRTIAIIAAIAAIVAAYYAYKTYTKQSEDPNVILNLYTMNGDEESLSDSIDVKLSDLKATGDYLDMEVPFRIGNHSGKDANKIYIWIKVAGNSGAQFLQPPSNSVWNLGAKPRQQWIGLYEEYLPPFSGHQLPSVILRIKKETKEVMLYWEALVSSSPPKSGSLILRIK